MSLNFPVDSVNHSRFILGEQLEHLTPPHAFDSENRETMTVNGLLNLLGMDVDRKLRVSLTYM